MPGLGRYPCTSCHYIATNRRMLARHSALIHCDKVFKCPVCPFITRYAANWYRHKRDQHGLSKLTTCDTCGFSASSTPELVQHREEEHPELLQLEKFEDKYAKEKVKLTEGNRVQEQSIPKPLNNDSDLLLDIYDIDQEIDLNLPPSEDDLKGDSIPYSSVNGHLGANLEGEIGRETEKESSPDSAVGMNEFDSPPDNLRPLRIRRSYNCDPCGLLTNNPREYLYHLRNIHGEKIAVHECKYCIYASKHIQKLQRHCNLVHRQQIENDPEFKRFLEVTKDKKSRQEMIPMSMPMHHPPNENFRNTGILPNKVPVKKMQNLLLKCSTCSYQARNKAVLFHHEKTVHMRKKTFRCTQCGYVTNEKSRYTKHIRYHNLPKLQCEYCFFKTAYKWNMERHMKNHEAGAEGDFHCPECNFTTSTKQSYNAHVTNHHDPSAESMEDQDIQDANGENDSNEWEDISMQENDDNIEENEDFDSYEFSDSPENQESSSSWKQGKNYQKNLKCPQCDFRAAWPFELKKHEENHRSQKKHSCPLCGMRFEHIAWLTKHLRKIHGEHSQAKNIAAAFDLLKPARRRPGKEYAADSVLPMFEEVLKQNNMANNGKNPESSKNSMLSSLLKKPLNPFAPQSVSKYNAAFKSKTSNQSSTMFKQPRISNYYQKVPAQEQSDSTNMNSKKVPTCNVCGYKTRWISELQRHMRVHSQEKPFHCHKCKYVCKWKGDLNRHLLKYHGIQMPPSKKADGSKFPVKKATTASESVDEWPSAGQEKRVFSGAAGGRSEESPLDLTLGRETFPHPNAMSSPYDAYDFEAQSNLEEESEFVDVLSVDGASPLMYQDYKSQVSQLNGSSLAEGSSNSASKLKYQCPQCPFSTTTASRFHVHIVQHYNKRPFMCSVCGYNSNWEWDISKHIRLKNCRDKSGNKACVLLTDESGRRNYEKYEKYLVDTSQPLPVEFPNRLPEINGMPEDNSRFNPPTPKHNYSESPSKNCSYDFRNIGSNFEDSSETVNIVVTPDINLPDPPETSQEQDNYQNTPPLSSQENGAVLPAGTDAKSFYCKHCLFKHSTKRVVVSHLSCHAGLKPYRCRVCGVNSNWRHVIVRHVKDIHNGYMNDVEERINFVQEGYALRLVSVNNDDPEPNVESETSSQQQFSCKICPYKCDKEFYMNFHMKQHRPREGAVYKCDYCPYFVKFKKTLVRHMKLHNPDISEDINVIANTTNISVSEDSSQPYTDDIYEFYDSQRNDSPADDSIAISFNQLSQLEESTSPQKIKRHICEHCPYKTDNKTQYLYHKQFHRPNPSAPFKCTSCSYWASMQHLLTQHMRVHSENYPEKNDSPKNGPQQFFDFFDDKGITEKISIEWVKKGEEMVKMFKCDFCPMMNKKKANVRVHQKMHGVVINDGRFACSYCNYQCLNQGGLTNHMKVHQKPGENGFRDNDRDYMPKKYGSFYEESAPVRKRTNSHFCFKCPGIFKTANDLASHSKFHGCNLPLKCTYCDYRAKHKPHITQHLAVHTAEYKAKRKASTPVNATPANVVDVVPPEEPVVQEPAPPKKIDQMLLLEASEAKGAMAKTGDAAKILKRCIICPATFFKTSILVYHVSLHGSEGEYKCSHCDYAVNRAENYEIHCLVHPKKSPVKRNLKTYNCTKCPAIFYKQDRFERHSELHGKDYKFSCDRCDYSVRYAANLIKHKKIHIRQENEMLLNSAAENTDAAQPLQDHNITVGVEGVNVLEVDGKKVAFICDRCPYFQMRKDAVQSHQRRHWTKDGFECPYCDYSSMQNSFLQNHIKLHVQPNRLFLPQAFIKFKSFQIYIRDDDCTEELLFDDENMPDDEDNSDCNENQEDEEKIHLVKHGENSTTELEPDSFIDLSESEYAKETEAEICIDDARPDEFSEQTGSQAFVRQTQPEIIKKYFSEFKDDSHTDSNLSSASCKSGKVPIVVLSDIFANDKDLKKWGSKLKIPKLKISTKYKRSSSSERNPKKLKASESYHNIAKEKNPSKPSLVVKIKVENCRVNKHEKTKYSVSTNSSDEHSLKEKDSLILGSAENTNDSVSDIFHDTDSSLQTTRRISISPVEDIEENTLTSNPGNEDTLKPINSIKDVMGSLIEPSVADLGLSQPTSDENLDAKSDDSFSNDTVPAVSDILCDKLDCLTELSFKDSDLSLTNGDCSNHLTSSGLNLLQEEIKVGL